MESTEHDDPHGAGDTEGPRGAVLAAAERVISRSGLASARVRDIANDARMSPASVLFHFPDNDELMLQLHRRAVDAYYRGRASATRRETDPRRRLVAMVLAGVPPYADEATIQLLYEMHGLSRRSAAHAELMSGLWRSERGLYLDVLEDGTRAGHFTPGLGAEQAASVLLALEDGLVLHLVSDAASLSAGDVIETYFQLAAAELDCPDLLDLARKARTT